MSAPSEVASGRRERKKLQTRRALQRAAVQLVTERGFEHVTVEDIADAADVSRRTFFNYFASKEEVVVGQDPEAAERVRAALLARPEGEPPLESLRVVLGDLAGEIASDREDWLAHRKLIRAEPRLLSASLAAWLQFERALVQAVAERTGCDPERDLYPALIVASAVGATRVALMHWRTRGRAPLGALVAEAFDALAAGLPVPAQGPARVTARTSAP